jgi:hypothetical protein
MFSHIYPRISVVKLRDRKTGLIFEVDLFTLRLSRLKRRLKYFSGWAKEVEEMVSDISQVMVTLTYRNIEDWRPRHITEFLRKVKRVLGPDLFGYFWVAEMQKRGAVHYHVILTVRKGIKLPKPDETGLWTYGMTRIELVRYVYAYLSKYLQKDGQKAKYPRGIRIFGLSIFVLKDWVRMNKLPFWLRELAIKKVIETQDASLLQNTFKKIRGGFTSGNYFFPSPWAFKGLE